MSVRFDWAGPLPLFPLLHRPTSCSATPPPVATRPQLPPGPGRALGPGFGSGGRGPSPLSVLPRPDSRVAERRPPGVRCPPSSASGWTWSGRRASVRGGVFLLWARGPLLQSFLPRELHLGALPQCTRKLQFVGVLIGGSLFGRDGSCGGKSPQDPRCSSRCELEPKPKFPPSPHSSSNEVSERSLSTSLLFKEAFCFVLTLPRQTLDSGLYRVAHFLTSPLLHL